jgi:hypothetical protein
MVSRARRRNRYFSCFEVDSILLQLRATLELFLAEYQYRFSFPSVFLSPLSVQLSLHFRETHWLWQIIKKPPLNLIEPGKSKSESCFRLFFQLIFSIPEVLKSNSSKFTETIIDKTIKLELQIFQLDNFLNDPRFERFTLDKL